MNVFFFTRFYDVNWYVFLKYVELNNMEFKSDSIRDFNRSSNHMEACNK